MLTVIGVRAITASLSILKSLEPTTNNGGIEPNYPKTLSIRRTEFITSKKIMIQNIYL